MENPLKFTPSEFVSLVNQTLEYSYSSVLIEGEVSSFKVNQNKWVFFDIKDEETSVSCFMTLYQLRMPLEDGMKIVVRGVPKVTKWGKFSFTVQALQPVGGGSLKKAFNLLKEKLTKEGLFNLEKKREIPKELTKIGVISSTGAAGYADFIKILNARWGGMKVLVAHTQVQGMDAPDQIIRALDYFNEHGEVQAIAILRGGGSADDLSCFNDERLVRAVAASKIPVITGIGHEVDESLCDLAADVRASTPSNAAEMLTRDRKEEFIKLGRLVNRTEQFLLQEIKKAEEKNAQSIKNILNGISVKYIEPLIENSQNKIEEVLKKLELELNNKFLYLEQKFKVLEALNPDKVLRQGYAILKGKISPGADLEITTFKYKINATIKDIHERS